MNIKSWLNSNAWYEAASQHYDKAAPHIHYINLASLGAAITIALLQELYKPINFKIAEVVEIITKPIGELTYTKNTIEQYEGMGRDITKLFYVRSTQDDKNVPVFRYTDTSYNIFYNISDEVYFFPVLSTDAEYDNQKSNLSYSTSWIGGIGHSVHDYFKIEKKHFILAHEAFFRALFPEDDRKKLEIHKTHDNHEHYIITPDILQKLSLTVDSTPYITSEQIKYNKSELWKTTAMIGQCVIDAAITIIIAAFLQCTLNLIIHLTKAAINGNSLKDATFESLQETKAIGHGLLAVGDYAVGGVLNVTIDPAKWLVKGAWNQTIGRLFHHDDEQATDIAGNITDALGSEA